MSRPAALAVLACAQLAASAALAQTRPAVVEMQTNLGTIAIVCWKDDRDSDVK